MVKNKDAIKKKIFYLIDFAISEKKNEQNNPYLKRSVLLAFELAKKINYRIPKEIHRIVCKNCFEIRNANNTKTRITRGKVNRKVKKYLQLHCLSCNYVKKISI
jgi:RNase P subunit RPR2